MITVDGKEHPWRVGMTVKELLSDLGLSDQCSVVRIDQQYVSRPYFEDTRVCDGADIRLIPMIVGG